MYDFAIQLRRQCPVRWHRDRLFTAVKEKTMVSNPPVISVVDDDASVRVGTENLLSSLGYNVHTFASAKEFLRSPHFSDTSCVIADVQMPAMSGVELQALLLAQGHHVPFIFITAFPDEIIRARALKAGAICFLTKPFDRLTLIKCLDTALQRHGDGTSE
jgi:FixJ family two-component response regulator